MWPTSCSSLYLGGKTIDRQIVAKNNLEILYPGPSKPDHLFVAQRKLKTVSRENNGIVPLPGGSNSRWHPPRRVRRRCPGDPYAAPSTAGPRIAAPSAPPVAGCSWPQSDDRSSSPLGTNSSTMWATKQILPMVLHLYPQEFVKPECQYLQESLSPEP